jgi:hypothetical protein
VALSGRIQSPFFAGGYLRGFVADFFGGREKKGAPQRALTVQEE